MTNPNTPDVARSRGSVLPLIVLIVVCAVLAWAAYMYVPQLRQAWTDAQQQAPTTSTTEAPAVKPPAP